MVLNKSMIIRYLFNVSIFCLVISFDLFAQFQNIRVSNVESKRPEEVTIAINRQNPQQIAAGANIDYFYISEDGGFTWIEQRLNSTLGVWGDPSVIYDNNGDLYFAHLSNPDPLVGGYWIDRIVVQKSTDNGLSWNDGAGVGYRFPANQDKEWLAVDRTQSPFRNNIYLTWTEFDNYGSESPHDSSRIMFSKSTDSGITWSESFAISDVSGNCIDSDETVEGAVPCVGPNGEIYVSWSGPLGIVFDKSTDGGITFGEDIHVINLSQGWDFDVPGIYRCNGMPITACDNSNSQFKGDIYINWADQRSREGDTDIYLIKSTDGGESWTQFRKVNDDLTNRHQFFTWMTIDQVSGYVYIVFYDRRNTQDVYTDVYLARSTDGGNTFTNHKINSETFATNKGVFFGDYINIDAHNGKIYPIWTVMNGIDLSVWMTVIDDSELITNVDEEYMIIDEYQLLQNYPNPFNPLTTISFIVPEDQYVKISIYDLSGSKIDVLTDRYYKKGIYEINFDATKLSSGTYYYTMNAGKFNSSKKMILIK